MTLVIETWGLLKWWAEEQYKSCPEGNSRAECKIDWTRGKLEAVKPVKRQFQSFRQEKINISLHLNTNQNN